MKKIIVLLCISCTFLTCWADIRLPKIISNGLVLQRNTKVKIWGWAEPQESVSLTFQSQTHTTKTDTQGHWEINLSDLKAGGPYTLQLKGNNQITFDNVLVGDVWVCSGQSNMELPMKRVRFKYAEEISKANNPSIRQFVVPQKYNFKAVQEDFEAGEWKEVNANNIPEFSAVAYFYAKELYSKYKVPIGLVNTSLGGSPAEAWMSEEALKQFPNHYAEAQKFKSDSLIQQIDQGDQERKGAWYQQAFAKDQGYKNGHWGKNAIDITSWSAMQVPGHWANTELGNVNGVVWFRKEFNVPATMAGKSGLLNLGCIIDADSVWINSVFIGNTSYMYPPRWYNVPEKVLQAGVNTIAIRIVNERGKGGFVAEKPYEISVGNAKIDLKGTWKYKLGASMEHLDYQTFIRWKPLGLYNAMLAPLLQYSMKGVIWYQGESNTGRAKEYKELFPAMIRNWRQDWKQGDFPFLFVQLANFMEATQQPTESNWALLREAQLKSLALPNTGMAITIDIGEWNDIHPLNKAEVGKRLALAAKHVAYKDNKIIYSGPVYKSMQKAGNSIILNFDHIGHGLDAKNGLLQTFAIAGEDQKFVWAEAQIKGTQVIVSSKEITNPVAVRYAWADNPQGANLYNKDGLPATPFRTDNW